MNILPQKKRKGSVWIETRMHLEPLRPCEEYMMIYYVTRDILD